MQFTGERFVPKKAFGEIEIEHFQRYYAIQQFVKDKVVLDAACGVGYGTEILAKTATHVYGVDIDKESIVEANENRQGNNITFLQNTIEKLPLDDKTIDVVVSYETIEHVDETAQNKFMQEIKRVLKPDAVLIISTPDKLFYSDVTNNTNPFHVKEFYKAEFKSFLSNYFNEVQMFNQGFEMFGVISSEYNTFDFNCLSHEGINQTAKYVISVCSDNKDNINNFNIESILKFDQKPFLSTTLTADLGEGFREDVVLYNALTLVDNRFYVKFSVPDELYLTKKFRWDINYKGNFIFKLDQVKPNGLVVKSLNGVTNGDYIDFYGEAPKSIIEGDFLGVKEITLIGEIFEVRNEKYIDMFLTPKIDRIKDIFNIHNEDTNITDDSHAVKNLLVDNMDELANKLIVYKEDSEKKQSDLNFALTKLQIENDTLDRLLKENTKEINHNLIELGRLREVEKQLVTEVNNLSHHYHSFNNQVYELQLQVSQLMEERNLLINSHSWKYTKILRDIGRLFRNVKKFSKKVIRTILKETYKRLPLKETSKKKLKKLAYEKFKFIFKNTSMYQDWLVSKQLESSKKVNYGAISSMNLDDIIVKKKQYGKIAIHLHLYYVDLLDEFFEYLNHMPVAFDLMVSIIDGDKYDHVKSKLEKMKNVEQVILRVTPNQGRDVAPMFSEFGDLIKGYDYFCHIHTKKSLYTGNQQDGWRNHLLSNLLGSPEIINKIFTIFDENKKIGFLYPDTFHMLPYWAHTWLSNKGSGAALLSRLGIKQDFSKYVDFSAGTMFWSRVDAIRPLLDINLKFEDFEEEDKQIDGTLAHAVERGLIPIVKSAGFDFMEYNFYHNYSMINNGHKNLSQYWSRNLNQLKEFIGQKELITFDIFDTLITRPLLNPDTLFKVIEVDINKKYGLKLDFMEMRKNAEGLARRRKEYRGDVSISEIYDELALSYKLDKNEVYDWMEMEKKWEIQLAYPKVDMISVFNFAKEQNKKILLISDMYLDKKTIESMLSKCGVYGFDELLVSSETQLRKDNGTVWTWLMENYDMSKSMHIGDNEHSDEQMPCDRRLLTYHVMNSNNLFSHLDIGRFLEGIIDENDNWTDSLLLGPYIAREFNSPFRLHKVGREYKINSYKNLGFSIFGPLFLEYMIWLFKQTVTNKDEVILFIAREGYLLKPLFDKLLSTLEGGKYKEKIETIYFLTSRRSLSVASFETEDQIYDLLDTSYEGSITNLLKSRYGLNTKLKHDKQIVLPRDKNIVKKILNEYMDEIVSNSRLERQNYSQYCKEMGLYDKQLALVDLGYAGTTQLYLSRFLKQSTTGYYFVTNEFNTALKYPNNKMKGYFGENQLYHLTDSMVYKYSLVLESILTSPEGQFVNFTKDLNNHLIANYGPKGKTQMNFDSIEKIKLGIDEYFDFMLEQYGDILLELNFSKRLSEGLIESLLEVDGLLDNNISDVFYVEDFYCQAGEVSVFDVYRERFKN